eukprot:UN04676
MQKLQQFLLEFEMEYEDDYDYDINVAVTNPKLNGLISSRLSVNIACSKYSDKMDEYCCFGTFMKEAMLKQLQKKLCITAQEMKNVKSKTLNLYWSGKPVQIETENNGNIKLMQITYIL